MSGTRWVREHVLNEYPEADIAVYAVWFNMIPPDSREAWSAELLDDDRVIHYWDEEKTVGRWISAHVDECDHLGPVDWDSYYLVTPAGNWDDTLDGIVACGTPIVKNTEALARGVESLFAPDSAGVDR